MAAKWNPISKKNVSDILLGYIVTIRNMQGVILEQQSTRDTRILISAIKSNAQHIIFVQGYTVSERGRPCYQFFNFCECSLLAILYTPR